MLTLGSPRPRAPPLAPVVSRQSLGRLKARLECSRAREPRGWMNVGLSVINTVMFLATLARQGWDKQEVHRGQIDRRKSAVSDRSAAGMYVHKAWRCKEEREVADAKGRNIHYSGEKCHKSHWLTCVWFTHSLKIHCKKAHYHVLASCALNRNSKKTLY